MRLDFAQNIINICRGKLLYLKSIADKSLAIENKKINITLEVRKDNIPAINLYKKHGFIPYVRSV